MSTMSPERSESLVFVYGTLMRGDCRHHVIASERFRGSAKTKPFYRLFHLGSYPGLVKMGDTGAAVEGELYSVSERCLKTLDEIEGVDDELYKRAIIELEPPFEEFRVNAYFYLGDVSTCVDLGNRWRTPTEFMSHKLFQGDRERPEEDRWRAVFHRLSGEAESNLSFDAVTFGFSGAGVLRVTANNRKYALRCWASGTFPSDRIRELHRYLDHLERAGLPVAVPLQDRDGCGSLISLGDEWWQLEPWLIGTPKTGATLSSRERRSMMRTLAQLHLLSERYVSSASGRQWFSPSSGSPPAIRERLLLIAKWDVRRMQRVQSALRDANSFGEQTRHDLLVSSFEDAKTDSGISEIRFRDLSLSILEQFQLCAGAVRKRLEALESVRVPLFPCWRDLWREHVLFQDEQVSGVIDATATRTDHPGTDLSRLLGSLFEDDVSAWGQALADYGEVRPLNSIDRELISALDQSSVLLSGMTWVQRWENRTLPADKLEAVCERLTIIERRLRQLGLSQI